MKAVPLAFHGVLIGLLSTSLHAQDPILSTPGTATWNHQDIGTGTRTSFSLTGNTVLNWDHLHLESGSELDFNFLSGDSVLNILSGGKTHFINGDVTSNGNVGFVSPNANLVVEGDITAKSVTLSTQNIDPVDFANGGDQSFAAGGRRSVIVRGNVTATTGDALFVAANIEISPNGVVRAERGGSILYAAGQNGAEISANGRTRIEVQGPGGVTNVGSSAASRIEINAGSEITNVGVLGSRNGNGRVFVAVGENGRISNEGSGVMLGVVSGDTIIDDGILLETIEGDDLSVLANSALKIPSFEKPDGKQVTSAQTVTTEGPMSASSDAGRQAKQRDRKLAGKDRSGSLLTRGGFFGVRGGGRKVASR